MSVFSHTARLVAGVSLALIPSSLVGCGRAPERALRADLELRDRAGVEADQATLDGSVDSQVAYAVAQHPELRAARARYRASVHRVAPARRLPDPLLQLGIYVWNSGENAGVTGARAGLNQELPWRTLVGADADAAVSAAGAEGRRLAALALGLKQRVIEAHHALWLVRRARSSTAEQVEILRGLSESALGRVATGAATLAEQQQVQLVLARLEDALDGLAEEERVAEARLRAVIAAPPEVPLRTDGEPRPVALPAEAEEELWRAAAEHPFIESFAYEGEAAEAEARASRVSRIPGLALGVEWMRMPGPSGIQAIAPSVGLRLPVAQRSYAEATRAAEAEAEAARADGEAALLRARAELEEALSRLRDSLRRVRLTESVLLPQAEAAYESVLGGYRVGESDVASSLLSQRDLLEVRLELDRARAEHAIAWARLEYLVGRSIERAREDDQEEADED